MSVVLYILFYSTTIRRENDDQKEDFPVFTVTASKPETGPNQFQLAGWHGQFTIVVSLSIYEESQGTWPQKTKQTTVDRRFCTTADRWRQCKKRKLIDPSNPAPNVNNVWEGTDDRLVCVVVCRRCAEILRGYQQVTNVDGVLLIMNRKPLRLGKFPSKNIDGRYIQYWHNTRCRCELDETFRSLLGNKIRSFDVEKIKVGASSYAIVIVLKAF